VHISSVAALGRTANGDKVDEEKKWEESKINTHYAKSKFKAELEVWRGATEGLSTVILNPSTILGYGDWNNGSCAIFKNVYKEFKWYSPGINGFVDVEDVAKATVLLMETDLTEERYIINGDNWHFRKLQDTMAANFRKKKPVRQTTNLLMAIAWRLEKIKSFFSSHRPLLTKESARIAHSKTFFQNDKILKALPGFSFTPLEESIAAACGKYLDGVRKLQP
jgi:nucleoside-diphosphate-sugar epimerase